MERNQSIKSFRSFDLLNVESESKIKDVFDLGKTIDICKKFWLNIGDCSNVMFALNKQMIKGLMNDDQKSCDLKMINSFVTNLPTGKERGKYIALDLGGTNYRILIVEFVKGESVPKIDEEYFSVSHEIMNGTADQLFDFIAGTVGQFVESRNLANEDLDLGFTFSFPVNQTSLSNGTLLHWTKGFNVDGVVGKDVVNLLNDKLTSKNIRTRCKMLVNDTVGTLAACAYGDPDTSIGLIVGTGTNAAYIEKIKNAPKLKDIFPPNTEVVINTEWGAFGEFGCLTEFMTEFDDIIDANSINPGKQRFEKMISGMYLGEIVRLILVKLIQNNNLFGGIVPQKLDKKEGFPTYYLSEVDRDPPHLYYSTEYILREDFGVMKLKTEDLRIVRYVCSSVVNRAASLVGAGIACLLNRIGRPRSTVAVDGSLFRFHPEFARIMISVITKLTPHTCTFRLKLSEDGSGKGAAALVAAYVEYLKKISKTN